MHRKLGLPAEVTVYEVGPRDGLQNEATIVPAATKVEFIARLVAAGLNTVEATSFVSPRWVPQLADAEEVFASLAADRASRYPVLVPNERGLDRALVAGARHVAIFASATESFAKRNLNCSIDESFERFAPVVARSLAEGVWVRAYVSMCFVDPWEGQVPLSAVTEVARRLIDLGCHEISLGDTVGMATPGHVGELLEALDSAGVATPALAVHFHDTYGQALANTLAALEHGVTTLDSSAGGLGGCPYAKSATGNLATEDLVWMLDGLGISTGVDLGSVVAASIWMAGQLGRPSPSSVVRAIAGTGAAT
ncbi:MAG: hydroxymethylglutaryl-CoA lyase [Acidimicrobiales bacterium]